MRTLRTVLLTAAFVAASLSKLHSQELSAKDDAEIRASVQGLVDAWNAHDMKAYVSFMADDVEWVNVRGSWWKGKAEVYRQHEALHETIFKTRQLYAPEKLELRVIAPGVVVATVVGKADGYATPGGQVIPPEVDTLTEVYAHRGGRWLLVEGHNTTVIPSGPRPAKP